MSLQHLTQRISKRSGRTIYSVGGKDLIPAVKSRREARVEQWLAIYWSLSTAARAAVDQRDKGRMLAACKRAGVDATENLTRLPWSYDATRLPCPVKVAAQTVAARAAWEQEHYVDGPARLADLKAKLDRATWYLVLAGGEVRAMPGNRDMVVSRNWIPAPSSYRGFEAGDICDGHVVDEHEGKVGYWSEKVLGVRAGRIEAMAAGKKTDIESYLRRPRAGSGVDFWVAAEVDGVVYCGDETKSTGLHGTINAGCSWAVEQVVAFVESNAVLA